MLKNEVELILIVSITTITGNLDEREISQENCSKLKGPVCMNLRKKETCNKPRETLERQLLGNKRFDKNTREKPWRESQPSIQNMPPPAGARALGTRGFGASTHLHPTP